MKPSETIAVALVSALTFLSSPASGQVKEQDSTAGRHFVGSSLFMLANAFPLEDPPSFYQLNYGYHLTNRDVLSIEAITWTYHAPLGIPFGPSYGSAEEAYPGSVKEYGLGVAYQRFLWKDLYTAAHALPLLKDYRDREGEHLQNGFQLFLTLRAGYQLRLLNDRFFLEPSVAVTHWPISTNMPESFAAAESSWPNYFLFEPGLHFGVRF